MQQLTLWFRDVEDAMRTPSAEAAELGMEEAFVLYRLTAKMLDMGNAFSKYVVFIIKLAFTDISVSPWVVVLPLCLLQ